MLTRRRAASRAQKAPSAEAEAPAAAPAPAAGSDDDEDLAFTSKKKKKRPIPVGSPNPCSLGSATARPPRYPGAGARLALPGSGWRAWLWPAFRTLGQPTAVSRVLAQCKSGARARASAGMAPILSPDSASLDFRKPKAPAADAEPAAEGDEDDDEVGFATGGGDDDDDDDDDDDGDDDGGDDALVGEGGFMSIPAGREYKYEELLDRMYSLLIANNPELAGDRRKFLMKPPQVVREGSKRVVFINFGDICKTMNRSIDHVNAFMLAEMGTTGSIDASNRMVIKGRFPPKAIEQIIRRYVAEYVTCSSCKSPATALQKQNRLFFMQCNNCGARRSVQPIKTGFVAIGKGARKKNRTG